ncbi:MAG: cyclic nucleotide-binding domain-containing protein, partial [Actinobacteria bacterium]|nr:cyclic nucleotide-binding domain-containing protein [Actinomycetota bacterium]
LGPGAFFGEIALLDGGPRSATVVAEGDVTTLSLPTWAFRSILKANPTLALKMLEEVCRRLRTSESSLTN